MYLFEKAKKRTKNQTKTGEREKKRLFLSNGTREIISSEINLIAHTRFSKIFFSSYIYCWIVLCRLSSGSGAFWSYCVRSCCTHQHEMNVAVECRHTRYTLRSVFQLKKAKNTNKTKTNNKIYTETYLCRRAMLLTLLSILNRKHQLHERGCNIEPKD